MGSRKYLGRLVRPSCSSHRSFPSLPRPRMDGHVMPSLALLIFQSMIVLASNHTLGCQGPIGNHMPMNCTVSIQMKIERFLLSRPVSGPRCKSLRPGPSLRHVQICWAPRCESGPVELPFVNPLLTLLMQLNQIGGLRSDESPKCCWQH